MEVFRTIKKRRSIRKFKPDPIPDEKLKIILEAARLAPSAGNRQPWRFVVVREDETRKKLAEAADGQTFVGEAPVVIAVFGDPSDSPNGYKMDPMVAYKQDPMIAVEHMCLEAVELGLGTCWIGPASPNYDTSKIKEILNVPKRMYMICLLPIGFPAESPSERGRKSHKELFFTEKYPQS
jgi:nitroreductase